ncbi:MAG: alanine--tRNA ligase [Ignavibacteriae bacterium]|nr:alanine--tRNA ligase [Ignavibacteriota bacterium]
MTSSEIRQQFLDFFKSKDHRIVESSPVVPFDDPTLLFTNAGMNQFKDVFLGLGKRDYTRAADTQKCIRVSGKHNDLEEVGYDTYHHTFFEMLGNWSFGDYYKEEAIVWAWELLTEVWKLPKERIWATVYRTDDEALDIWKSKTDINPNHVLKFDEKDNFWEMGDTGPCGPCSEIHINLSDNLEDASLVNAGDPRCIEIWNLVFIQYNRDETGKLNELPAKHVDTGMGFERVCAVLQGKSSNYDTDVFTPLLSEIEKISGIKYEKEEDRIAMRVIADHARTLTVAIADGAVPGNEGRSYVLRRILRRASRYGRKLNLKEPFIYKIVEVVASAMGSVFPEIVSNKENIEKIIKAEEESFNATLDRGIELFENIISKNSSKVISGDDVFKLYDTFGFPVDLTNVMAKEKGFSIDEERFNELMNEQRERARADSKKKTTSIIYKDHVPEYAKNKTVFVGYHYDNLENFTVKNSYIVGDGMYIFNETPFYAESGGQIGDTGIIELENGERIKIINTIKIGNDHIHEVEFRSNKNFKGARIDLVAPFKVSVDKKRRWDIMRNHTATHLLNAALREILGPHIKQNGSLVEPNKLRFDFSHFNKLSDQELLEVETFVNERILKRKKVEHLTNIPIKKASKKKALMFFGDKYGEYVNLVKIPNVSLEFCGGTHVRNTSQIGLFKIISESSIASGVRRIEAVTGKGVEEFIKKQDEKIQKTEHRVNELLEEKKKLEKEIAELLLKEKLGGIDSIISLKETVEGIDLYKGKVEASNMDELKSMGDELRNKIKSGIGLMIAEVEDKVQMVCVVSDDLIKEKNLSAGKIVGDTAKILGGGGGGRPHLATAGGKDASKIDEALSSLSSIISKYL